MAAAELSVTNRLYRSAVNRGYYSMFYGVLALLASRQAETSKHSGAISQFDQFDSVVFLVGATNVRSRRALEKIGAVLRDRRDTRTLHGQVVDTWCTRSRNP